ncbi:hypothetical protein KC19_3G133500 [Ceratodon purpureus]|nr:hypothetical protein KC19_3G133500 [Ceratodon purpureus]
MMTKGGGAPESGYTEDGTVDLHGKPVLKANTGGWKACPFILGQECCERLAYYGIATNMVIYLKTQLHQHPATASNNVTNWSGTCYITPLIGAFFADAYLGRFWTIVVFSIIYCLGMVLLTLSAAVPSLKPPQQENAVASSTQLGVFYLALYLVALGTGGIKPCVSSFGADQFDENDVKEKKRKTSFFNWFYFSINIGALIASSALVYIQENVGWGWGFGIPAVAMGIAILSFLFGSPRYRHQKPGGSPLTRIAQVIVAAFRKLHVKVDPNNLYELHDKESGIEGSRKLNHTKGFRFLDKAATPKRDEELVQGGKPSAWRLTSVTQVEEVKIILRLLPIWASGIVFATVYSQMSTMFVQQGALMNVKMGKSFEIPAASLSIFDTLSVIVCVPLYDRLLVPFVRKRTGHVRGFTQLQRMGIGLVISVLAMVVAAVVEIERLKIAKRDNLLGNPNDDALAVNGISIFWQIPQYFLIGAAEVFTFIGQLEFFYDQAPDAMRSLMSALSLTTVSLGNYLSTVLVTIVTKVSGGNGKVGWIPNNLNRGHLDYFFWLLAVLSVLNIIFYLVVARLYTYKRVQVADAEVNSDGTKPVKNSGYE